MKKLFNYALLAAALLVGVNVNAVNDCTVSIDGGAAEPASFQETMDKLRLDAHDNTFAYAGKTIVITLTDEVAILRNKANIEEEGTYYDFFIYPGTEASIDVTINMAGHNITSGDEKFFRFYIVKGKLTFTGEGSVIEPEGDYAGGTAIMVGGSSDDVEDTYAELVIDEKVRVITPSSYGVALQYAKYTNTWYNGKKGNNAFTVPANATNVSNGAVITIKGYIEANIALSTNGTMSYLKNGQFVTTKRPPIITVEKSAQLKGSDKLTKEYAKDYSNDTKAAILAYNKYDEEKSDYYYMSTGSAIYAPGYAIYNVYGKLSGGCGIYIKGGKFDIKDAKIKATASEYWPPITYGNGFIGAGSAIVMDSNEDYGKLAGVEISGNTEISSDMGYGIEETATSGETKVPEIVIESGTISGGEGSIATTVDVKDDVVLNGTISGGTFSDSKIQDYLPDVDGVIVPHTDPETGVTTYSVETIPGGIDEAEKRNIHESTEDDDVAIKGKDEIVASDEELVCQSLIVEEDATLTINGKLTVAGLNIAGKVTVAQNGILIVKEKGVVCFNAQDFVIEAKEGAMGQFLLSPDVEGNTHPTATVQFVSKAKELTTWDRFGVPAYEGMTPSQVICETKGTATYLFTWNNVKNDWDQVKSASQVLLPFQGLTQTNNSAAGGVVYDFPCSLVGNANASLNLVDGWNSFSNSYTAKADVAAYLKHVMDNQPGVGGFIFTYVNGQETTKESWNVVSYADVEEGIKKELDPMQAFIIRKVADGDVKGGLDYEKNVWNPAMGINNGGNNAPRQMVDMNKVVINLTDAQGNEGRLTIREAAEFTADYENGYDVPMYESTSKFNFYATTDYDNQVQIATNDIEGQLLTLATKEETSYTMSFSNVRGEMMAIRDNMTGDVIEMAEGVTYNFMANANEVSERFTIIAAAKAPTAIQKAKASAKAAKFIRHDQVVLQNNGRFFNVLGADVK